VVSWEVTNDGPGAVPGGQWRDAIFLSSSAQADQNAAPMGSVLRTDLLSAGASYDAELSLTLSDPSATGTFYIGVATNTYAASSQEGVFEGYRTRNNVLAVSTQVVLPPPSDLIVTSVVAPVVITPGQDTDISWSLQNIGANTASGTVRSIIYLSTDSTLSDGDPVVAVQDDPITLSPSSGQMMRAHVDPARALKVDALGNYHGPAPGLPVGAAFVIVRTNVTRAIRESDYGNDLGHSAIASTISVDTLIVGIERIFNTPTSIDRYFRVHIDHSMDLRLSVTGRNAGDEVELFESYGATPSRSLADTVGTRVTDNVTDVSLSGVAPGDVYLLVHRAASDTTMLDVRAEELGFTVLRAFPVVLGAGRVTMTVSGGGFTDSTVFDLVDSGGAVAAQSMPLLVTSTSARVRWMLQNVSFGKYRLEARRGLASATLTDTVSVVPATPMTVAYSTTLPPSFRAGPPIEYVLSIRNTGNVDAEDVEVLVGMTEGVLPLAVPDDGGLLTSTSLGERLVAAVYKEQGVSLSVGGDATFPALIGNERQPALMVPLETTDLAPDAVAQERLLLRPGTPAATVAADVEVYSKAELISGLLRRIESGRLEVLDSLGTGPSGVLSDSSATARMELQWFVDAGVLSSSDAASGGVASVLEPQPAESIDERGAFTVVSRIASDRNAIPRGVERFDGAASRLSLEPTPRPNDPPPFDPIRDCMERKVYNREACWAVYYLTKALPLACTAAGGPGVATLAKVVCGAVGIWATQGATATLNNCLAENSKIDCSHAVIGYDPNDLVGPAGSGARRWIPGRAGVSYAVRFENDPKIATAPAQGVSVVANIDSALDIRQVRLGGLGFAGMRFEGGRGRSFWSERLRVADSVGVNVDVTAGIDVVKRQVFWNFRSIDPTTGDTPLNPRAGFLAVDDGSGRGVGVCEFGAMTTGASHAYAIGESASVVFDQNAPVATNTWMNWVDTNPPTSRITGATNAGSEGGGVILHLTASDAESGIGGVEVFVSEDGADYADAGAASGDSSFVLATQGGHSYGVYSLAMDIAGNVEAKKPSADLAFKWDGTTSVGPKHWPLKPMILAANPLRPNGILRVLGPASRSVRVQIFDIAGRRLLQQEKPGMDPSGFSVDLRMADLRPGMVWVRAEGDAWKVTRPILILQ
jgi:hypothetical protein